jgi:uncharacterized protein (TIGR02118 family)
MFKTYYFLEGDPQRDPFRVSSAEAAAKDSRLARAAGVTLTRSLPAQIDSSARAAFAGAAEIGHFRATDALAHAERGGVGALLADGVRIGPVITGLARVVMRTPDHHGSRGIKCLFPFRRMQGMSIEAFQRRWWHGHGPIAARTENALFYLQTHPLIETYTPEAPAFDGVTELHWHDLAAARAAMASRQMREDQGRDAPHFAAAGSVLMFAAQEEIVRAP